MQTKTVLACVLVALAIGSQAGARPAESTACSSTSPSGRVNLTGRWAASDSTPYYLRQKGTCLWWIGGKGRTNVFFGSVFGASVTGVWADVFAGSSGTLTLSISQSGRTLTLRASTPPFVTKVLRKT
jgi:hypothetical protein